MPPKNEDCCATISSYWISDCSKYVGTNGAKPEIVTTNTLTVDTGTANTLTVGTGVTNTTTSITIDPYFYESTKTITAPHTNAKCYSVDYNHVKKGDKNMKPCEKFEKKDPFYGIDRKFRPKRVIFNDPATIVFWEDGTKTVVKCSANEKFSKYAGFCAALTKKIYDNNSLVNRIVEKAEDESKKVEKKSEKSIENEKIIVKTVKKVPPISKKSDNSKKNLKITKKGK